MFIHSIDGLLQMGSRIIQHEVGHSNALRRFYLGFIQQIYTHFVYFKSKPSNAHKDSAINAILVMLIPKEVAG